MIFDRPGFGYGVMKMEYTDEDGNPQTVMISAKDNGKDIGDGDFQTKMKGRHPKWFMSQGEHSAAKAQRKKNKDEKKARTF